MARANLITGLEFRKFRKFKPTQLEAGIGSMPQNGHLQLFWLPKA